MNENTKKNLCESVKNLKHEGYHCSEAMIREVPKTIGMEVSDEIVKAACGFFGGGGGIKDRCGIFEVALMLISLKYGRVDASTSDQAVRDMALELENRFFEKFGSLYCRDIKSNEVAEFGETFGCERVYQEGACLIAELFEDADKIVK